MARPFSYRAKADSGKGPRSFALYNLTPVPWNSVIGPGQFIAAGLCANKTGANFTPQVVFTQSN